MTQNSQNTCVSYSRPQDCPLCNIWARMPYAKRWSTPTTVYDTEGALIVGYWIGLAVGSNCRLQPNTLQHNLTEQERQPLLTAGLCQKHSSLIQKLNQTQINTLVEELRNPQSPAESKPEPEQFRLGPGPLTNENTITEPPPLPVTIPFPGLDLETKPDPNAEYGHQQVTAAIDRALQSPPVNAPNQPQGPIVDPMELARQAALMPATEGRRMESFDSNEPDESTKH